MRRSISDWGRIGTRRTSAAKYTTLQHTDEGEIPVCLLKIESVTYHEAVRDFETTITDRHIGQPPDRAIQKSAHVQASRTACAERPEQVAQRQAGIDNIL